ncbi:heavy metal transporter [Aureimonas sp. Leaf454]|uniref:heavy-metal-associated domain-containing protein n=1 Tax=Aureimonas sp. Leaf454 TaxID=1736381 RepID=UPI0006F66831|nr:heavy-metal-associated domain-containing protein [Aureimonas sp. Leaf454]KQT51142.1 heavy metal transporter [Aureimonas sp. Leaf454]
MLKLKVQEMNCGHCVSSVTKAIKKVDPNADVQVDLGSGLVTVDTSVGSEAVRAAVKDAGYPNELAA